MFFAPGARDAFWFEVKTLPPAVGRLAWKIQGPEPVPPRFDTWNSTAILVNWDDWGGWYDHLLPPVVDNMGPGFRTPLLVISPYAKHGYVSHQVSETASLLTFIEKNFNLPSTGARDATASDLSDFFDYTQTVTPFVEIKHKVTVDTIMKEAPSGPPDPDDD